MHEAGLPPWECQPESVGLARQSLSQAGTDKGKSLAAEGRHICNACQEPELDYMTHV